MSTMKYSSLDLGTIEAVFNKLGGLDGARKFLRDELLVSEPTRTWREADGVIYFSVVSDGTTGPEWIARLEKKGDRVGTYAKQLLCSSDFQPTAGVTYQIAVLKGNLFNDRDRNTKNIRNTAEKHQLTKPNAEIACLIRDQFTDKEIEAMSLVWIVTMHEPIKDSGGNPSLLSALRYGSGHWLNAYCDQPNRQWNRDDGFAFVVSQVN